MPTNIITPNRGYQLPFEENFLDYDVLRLISALTAVDADVADLFAGVSQRAPLVHDHAITDVIGLTEALAGKSAAGHTHNLGALSDVSVTGATTGQFLKKNASAWVPASIEISDVTNLQTAIDAPRPISNITDLQATLDGKAVLKGSALVVPRGPTSGRPSATSADALFRQNTDTGQFEAWDGTDWQGFNPFDSAAYLPKSGNLTGLADPDTAISNLGGNANGRDIFKNASAIGATVAKAADAAAGRSALYASAGFNFVQGLILSNNVADATNDIDLSAGAAQAGSVYVANPSVMTKRLDANWSAGNNGGGLDTGAKANSATYHAWALRKTSDASFDWCWSLSATSPAVPTGYVAIQRLGAILTDGSGAICPFIQDGNEFRLRITAGLNAFTGTADRALALLTVPLPLGIRVLGLFTGAATYEPMYSGATDQGLLLADGADINTLTLGHMFGAIPNIGYVQARSFMDRACRTNTSAQIYMGIIGTNPGTASTLVVRGWVDESIPRI